MAGRQRCPHWESAANGSVPANAVELGKSALNGEMMYVGRITASLGDILPGKVVPSHRTCYASLSSEEIHSDSYEVLVNSPECCKLHWIEAKNGKVPAGAIEAGRVSQTNEPLYIARAHVPGEPQSFHEFFHGGKVHPSHGVAYVPYGGQEVACKEYEVLCQKYLWA